MKGNDESTFLFNSLNRNWIRLHNTIVVLLDDLSLSPDRLHTIHPELYKVLLENGYIVENEQQDVSLCLQTLDKNLSSRKHLDIVINPTLDCNLRCWYCYEDHLKGSCMNIDTINRVISYIYNQIDYQETESIQLSFFGGEPLLRYKEVVEPILEKVSHYCLIKRKELMVSITTNGVCLNDSVLYKLKHYTKQLSFQIAFDGGKDQHNITKFFLNGVGCYNIVIKNTIKAIQSGSRVVVRCNYTSNNLLSFIDLIRDLKEWHSMPNLYFSFHRVWQEEETEIPDNITKKFRILINGFKFNSNIGKYLGDSLNPCYCDYLYNVVINYTGDVFKCTARNFSNDNSIGIIDINGKIQYSSEGLKRLLQYNLEICHTCRMLPICPICSQRKSENKDGKCPIEVNEEIVQRNMQGAFLDLYRTFTEKL